MRLRSEVREEEQPLGDILLWSHVVAAPDPPPRGEAPSSPTVIQNKDGALMATLTLTDDAIRMLDYTEWAVTSRGWSSAE
jgi:hypothetical protein